MSLAAIIEHLFLVNLSPFVSHGIVPTFDRQSLLATCGLFEIRRTLWEIGVCDWIVWRLVDGLLCQIWDWKCVSYISSSCRMMTSTCSLWSRRSKSWRRSARRNGEGKSEKPLMFQSKRHGKFSVIFATIRTLCPSARRSWSKARGTRSIASKGSPPPLLTDRTESKHRPNVWSRGTMAITFLAASCSKTLLTSSILHDVSTWCRECTDPLSCNGR